MRKLRILLSLLLCVTVPVAAWASVVGGARAHPHPTAHGAPVYVHVPGVLPASQHDHRLCTPADHHRSGAGERCACACGVGACTAPALWVLTRLPVLLLSPHRDAPVVFAAVTARALARNTAPLRPPIS